MVGPSLSWEADWTTVLLRNQGPTIKGRGRGRPASIGEEANHAGVSSDHLAVNLARPSRQSAHPAQQPHKLGRLAQPVAHGAAKLPDRQVGGQPQLLL